MVECYCIFKFLSQCTRIVFLKERIQYSNGFVRECFGGKTMFLTVKSYTLFNHSNASKWVWKLWGIKLKERKISCSVEYEAYKDILKNFISSLSINVSNWNYFYVNKGKMFITCSISNSSFWFLYLNLNIKM